MITKTVGSWNQCDLVVEGEKVAHIHAQLQLANDGYLTLLDADSEHGTWLQRNEQWIRVMKVELGSRDGIRLGDQEVPLARLLEVFDEPVRLRDHHALRIPAHLAERLAAAGTRVLLERPKRNPETGTIEEGA
jgi:FHA domain